MKRGIEENAMHMADALLSPAIGGAMLAVSAGAIGFSVKKISAEKLDEKKIPLMGIMGAFVFAGQMINFTIPGTGSSGHIGGGLLLAATLGPWPALIALASVLLIQCLFFADGGLLAFGCNVFNMAVPSCVFAFTFIYKPLVKKSLDKKTITLASLLAVIAGLQLGAFAVVVETTLSGITELPFGVFLLAMQPIHLAIGLGEGLITAAVLCYIHAARPEVLREAIGLEGGGGYAPIPAGPKAAPGYKKMLVVLGAFTLIVAALLSIYASSFPDGLEWSMEKVAGSAELEREGPVYDAAAGIVEKTAFMPDYAFKDGDGGTPVAGIVGSLITVAIAGGAGLAIHALRRKSGAAQAS
jgi:cobalt/nickel transport system permease protein